MIDAALLAALTECTWTSSDGQSYRVVAAPPEGQPAGGAGYPPEVQELLQQTAELSLLGEGSAEPEVVVRFPPLGPEGRPADHAHADLLGGIWVPFSDVDGDGFVYEVRHGAVVYHSASYRELVLADATLEAWLRQWLALTSIDDLAPKGRIRHPVLKDVRGELAAPLKDLVADVPDDWELLSFEDAAPGTAFELDERELRKLADVLAWVRPPPRRCFFRRLFVFGR